MMSKEKKKNERMNNPKAMIEKKHFYASFEQVEDLRHSRDFYNFDECKISITWFLVMFATALS